MLRRFNVLLILLFLLSLGLPAGTAVSPVSAAAPRLVVFESFYDPT